MSLAVEQIIKPFLAKTPSKADIDAAEKAFEDAKRDQPAALIEQLFTLLSRGDVEVAAREQAVVLLRKCLEKAQVDESSPWKKLGQGQAAVLAKLLQILEVEMVPAVRRKVADLVQSLGNQIINIDASTKPNNCQEWPDLIPTLMRIIVDTSKDAGIRADCLYAVKELALSICTVMLVNGTQTLQVLTMCFQDASEAVAGNTLNLYLELLNNVGDKADRQPFQPLLPEITKVLQKVASGNDIKTLKAALEILGSVEEGVAKFLSPVLGTQLMPCLCTIAKGHADEDVQKTAFEAVLTLLMCDCKGSATNPGVVGTALEVCTHFMISNLSDDLDEWANLDDDSKDLDEEELFRIGRDGIDRCCRAAQEAGKGTSGSDDRQYVEKVMELLKPALATLFGTGQWKQTVCGLSIFQQIAEYVDDSDTVIQMLTAVHAQLKASHIRVRHIAWTCISQFSEDHMEILSVEPCVGQIMTSFVEGLDDTVDRVVCRSMEAFQHFGENVEREDMEPFVKPLMQKLAPKLKGSIQVQRKAITTVAVVAGQVEDSFAEYYADLMPYLKAIIGNTLHNVEERTLLGKCFECISLLAKAIGRKGFKQDAEMIMEAMIKATQVPNLPNNDPVKEYMMAASQRICAVLKEDFLPMIPHVLPQILEKFTLAPKDFTKGEIKAEDINEDDEVTLTMTKDENGNVKFLFMSTSDLEDLECALQSVHTYIEELGAGFAPFVPQTAKALLPVFDFNIDEGIRDLAFETWGNLCKCAQEGNQPQVVSDLVMEFLKRVVPAFDQDENLDLEAMKTKAEGITTVLKKAGPNMLQPDQVNSLVTLTLTAMKKSFVRREEHVQETKKSKDDADLDTLDEEENLRTGLAEIAGALMRHHPDIFVSCGLQPYLELIATLKKSSGKDDRKLILFIACDFLGHLGPRAVAHWDQFLPLVLEDIVAPDSGRRQPACYATSLAALQPAFKPVAVDTAAKLQQVVTQSRGRAKKKSEKPAQACADNALSGLIAILENHKDAVGAGQEQLWDVWLTGLPCQEDEEEGVKNHKLLLKFVMDERIEVLKQGASNFPKVLALLVDQYKTNMVDEETNKGIRQLVLNLGQGKLEQFAGGMSEKQKKKLLRVHREATTTP